MFDEAYLTEGFFDEQVKSLYPEFMCCRLGGVDHMPRWSTRASSGRRCRRDRNRRCLGFNFAIKDVIAEYEKATGNHVKLSLGSSGNFYAQIQNGAPFDLYFSADIGYPKKLEEAGLIVPGSLYRYAVGRIVLWTNHASRRDVSRAPHGRSRIDRASPAP